MHLKCHKKVRQNETYVICKLKIPCTCSKLQAGVKGQLKWPSAWLRGGAFVTYCNISCFTSVEYNLHGVIYNQSSTIAFHETSSNHEGSTFAEKE